MSVPRTSITVCSYNMLRYLPGAIDSALKQTANYFEILILDDGSTDGTFEYLRTLRSHSSIRVLQHTSRQGLTACRNHLLAESRGEYISILDADDEIFPEKVAAHEKILDADPDIGMVWGRTLVKNQEDGTEKQAPPADYIQGWDLTESYQAVHSATTWRRSALRRVGGYDPRYTLVEDADMYLKIGDFSKQVFHESLTAMKRLFPQNAFRKNLSEGKIRHYSRELLKNTVTRRYSLKETGTFFRKCPPKFQEDRTS